MTPKAKAEELIEKYSNQPINFPYIDTKDVRRIGNGYMTHLSAKICAKIAIREILSNAKDTIPILSESSELVCSKEYWLAVKQEIETL